MSTKTWRGGMIGAGAWSDVQLTAWAGVENARIVALCDRHPDRRDPLAERYEIPNVFDDLQSMLDQMDLDFVDICTRPYSHAELARQAAERGLPVLCQKPFCTSMDEAHRLVDFCNRMGVRLMINENYRWQAWFRKARELLDAGLLGKPFVAKIDRRTRFTLPRFDHNQAYFADMPQLIVYEMGVHFLDVLRFLFGEPKSVYARLHHVSPHMKGEDVQLLILGYDDMTCLVNQSWASVQVPGLDRPLDGGSGVARFEIDGTKGTLSLHCDGSLRLDTDTTDSRGQAHFSVSASTTDCENTRRKMSQTPTCERLPDCQQWSFPEDTVPRSRIAAQEHFIHCLATGKPFETNGRETLKTMALVHAAYLSAAEHRAVDPRELALSEGGSS